MISARFLPSFSNICRFCAPCVRNCAEIIAPPAFFDDDEIGALQEALAAMIWHFYNHSSHAFSPSLHFWSNMRAAPGISEALLCRYFLCHWRYWPRSFAAYILLPYIFRILEFLSIHGIFRYIDGTLYITIQRCEHTSRRRSAPSFSDWPHIHDTSPATSL